MDSRQAMHSTVAFGNPTASRPVHADRVNLVEISHGAIPLGHIANLCDRRDIAIHRIDRLETDELRPPGIGAHQAILKVDGVVVAENFVLGAAVPDALDHRGVVCRIGEHDTVGNLSGQRGNSRLIGDISRSEQQRPFFAVEIRKLIFQEHMVMAGSGMLSVPPAPAPTRSSASCMASSTAGCWPMPR